MHRRIIDKHRTARLVHTVKQGVPVEHDQQKNIDEEGGAKALKSKHHANGYAGKPAEQNTPARPIGLKISTILKARW